MLPETGVQGTIFSVIFSGNNLSTASAVVSNNPGITGSILSANDNTVTAEVSVNALATTGLTTLGLTTLGGSATASFTVLHKAPVIIAIVPNVGDQGSTVNAQIQGVGTVNFFARKNGNQIIVHAQDSAGKVIGKAETVAGLKQTPIYISASGGLEKITIYWGTAN